MSIQNIIADLKNVSASVTSDSPFASEFKAEIEKVITSLEPAFNKFIIGAVDAGISATGLGAFIDPILNPLLEKGIEIFEAAGEKAIGLTPTTAEAASPDEALLEPIAEAASAPIPQA
jgi:hypothetical protein